MWPALTVALVAWIVAVALWLRSWLHSWALRARARIQHEHERLTGWFGDLKQPGAGAAIMRDDTDRIILPSRLLGGSRKPGRHRAKG